MARLFIYQHSMLDPTKVNVAQELSTALGLRLSGLDAHGYINADSDGRVEVCIFEPSDIVAIGKTNAKNTNPAAVFRHGNGVSDADLITKLETYMSSKGYQKHLDMADAKMLKGNYALRGTALTPGVEKVT